jgi:micrococcal nuclease
MLSALLPSAPGTTSTDSPSKGNAPSEQRSARLAGRHRVKRVIDGDTVVLGSLGKVRLLGIDAPELHHPNKPVERCAVEARGALERLLGADRGEVIVVVSGDGGPLKRDAYKRVLAYVRAEGQGESANEAMVEAGWAKVYRWVAFKQRARFITAERHAMDAERGIWSPPGATDCAQPLPGPAPAPPSPPPPAPGPASPAPAERAATAGPPPAP